MTRQDDLGQPDLSLGPKLGRIAEELKAPARSQHALHELYSSVLGRDVGLKAVLRLIVTAAMDLVDARYGALGVLNRASAVGRHRLAPALEHCGPPAPRTRATG